MNLNPNTTDNDKSGGIPPSRYIGMFPPSIQNHDYNKNMTSMTGMNETQTGFENTTTPLFPSHPQSNNVPTTMSSPLFATFQSSAVSSGGLNLNDNAGILAAALTVFWKAFKLSRLAALAEQANKVNIFSVTLILACKTQKIECNWSIGRSPT